MADYQAQCETMLLEGQMDQAQQAALAWARHPATGADTGSSTPFRSERDPPAPRGVSRSLEDSP